MPINYWLEYLDVDFSFKCKAGLISLNLDDLVEFCSGCSCHGLSALLLKNNFARTSFRDSYLNVRISNLWNVVPEYIKSESLLESFKKKLKSFFFYKRLAIAFIQEDICFFKLVCPKCRLNIFTSYTC